MIVTKKGVIYDSCNLCRSGKLSESGDRLKYPYTRVWEVRGDGALTFCICDHCLQKLNDLIGSEEGEG